MAVAVRPRSPEHNPVKSEWMARALHLANLPAVCVLPNPRVGAVLVAANSIIGEGYHRGPGHPHAEVEAFRAAEAKGLRDFRHTTLYVTLEPCCHTQKRTPPCAPYLLDKRIGRVVVGMRDPNPLVSGRGIRLLKNAGVEVIENFLEAQAIAANQAFIKNQRLKLPYVTLKLASTFDGRLADDRGHSQWITGPASRQDVHRLRARVSAIGIGARTMDLDNPKLNTRLSGRRSQPQQIVIFGRPKRSLESLNAARANGLDNIYSLSSRLPLKRQLKTLYGQKHICHLLVEGGGQLASAFLSAGLVDELVLYYGRGFLGGHGTHLSFRESQSRALSKIISFRPETIDQLDGDLKVQGRIRVYRPR